MQREGLGEIGGDCLPIRVLKVFYLGEKGGDEMNLEGVVTMESERVMNLVRGFSWEKVKEEVRDHEVYITIKKKMVVEGASRPGIGEGEEG